MNSRERRQETSKRIFLGAVLFLGIAAVSYAYDDGDFQVWNTEVEEFKLNKNTKLALEEEFRWGDNSEDFYYQHYDLGLMYGISKSFAAGGGYRHIYEKKKGKFKIENEPYLAASFAWDWAGFKLDNRGRLEYRHFDYQDDSFRYRNKFKAKLPWKFTKLEIQPYLSDEMFFSFLGVSFNQNRFYSGLGFNITKDFKGEIYYLLQSTRSSGNWQDINALGTKFKLSF